MHQSPSIKAVPGVASAMYFPTAVFPTPIGPFKIITFMEVCSSTNLSIANYLKILYYEKKVTLVTIMESFNIDNYLDKLILRCKEAFSGRLVYVGLQGSWLRGEVRKI